MILAEHVARIGYITNAYKILVGKLTEKKAWKT